jgi:hypothetical protein
MEEKRKLERFDLKIPAKIKLADLSQDVRGEEIPDLMTNDISSGGAFFHTTKPLPKGTDISIDLILPLDKLKKLSEDSLHALIKVTGTVIRTESGGMAISFDSNYQISPVKKDE